MYMRLLYIHIAKFTYIQVLKNEDKEIGPKKKHLLAKRLATSTERLKCCQF